MGVNTDGEEMGPGSTVTDGVKGDCIMGVNTDGEEISSGSSVPAGVEQTETACGYDQQHEHGQSLTQDADCDEGIQDQKSAKGSGLPLITSLQNMRSQHISGALNTEHNEAQIEHTDGEDRVLSNTPTLLRPDADTEDEKIELPRGALVNTNTDTSADDKCLKLEECSSSLQPEEIMDISETDTNDDSEAMYDTLLDEISPSDDKATLELSFNHDLDQIDDKGYTPLYKAALEGHLEDVDALISQGANPNKPSKGGLRPLHAAAHEGQEHTIDFLILQGADVSAECERGRTPLQTAAAKYDKGMNTLHGAAIPGDLKVMEYLIHIGSYLKKEDAKDSTPVNAAVQNGHIEALKYLMTEGAEKNRYFGMTPLCAAAELGNLDVVKYFISEGADVNEEDKKEKIALHGAAIKGHVEVMKYLVQQGSDVNKKANLKWTPFNAAVQYGHVEAVKYLMTQGVEQNRYAGMTPLYAAAQFGHLDLVKFFIINGADVNEKHDKGMIPLHGAAIRGHLKIMEYLIQQGSDVDNKDAKGTTPLNAAVQNGHLEAVKYLMTKGAKQNRYFKMTPLYAAAQSGHLDIVKYFISKGADVNEEDDEGMIPLHGAAFGGHIEVMEYLIQQGSDVNKGDAKGRTPFNAAVQYGHLNAVKHLMAKGAKLTKLYGLTPLYITAQYGHVDVVNFLVSSGYDVNERNECGKSPRHAACYNGNMDIVKALVHHNANVNEQDDNGWTPLHAAAQEGHQDIVNYLTLNEADMNMNDIDGLTPLQAAAYTGHPHVMEGISSRRSDLGEEEAGDPRTGGHQNIITRGCMTVSLQDADTQSRTGKVASQVDNAEDGNDCSPADNAKRRTVELFLKNLSTRTHDEDTNAAHPNTNEHLSPRRGYPNEEDTGDRLSEGRLYGAKHLATGSYAKKKVIQMKEADKQSRTGHLASQTDNAEEGNDCTQADNTETGADEPSLKNLSRRTHEEGDNGEHNPFIHAKLKYHDKGEQEPTLDQMEASKSPGTRRRDTISNGTDRSFPHEPQTWQYIGFDPPFLQTMGTDGPPSEEPESRCHSLIDEKTKTRESSSPMNAGNDTPINETSTELDSSPKHPPDVVPPKLYDRNPVSTFGTSSNPVRKIRTKRQKSVRWCPSILALVQTFLQMIIALTIILAGSPVLVAGTDINERVTLQAGKRGMVPFYLPWPPNSTSHGFFTLGFKSKPRPFCINGTADVKGFKSSSQLPRFTTSVKDLGTSPCVNLIIDNVDSLDEGVYVLLAIWHSFENVRYETIQMEVDVQTPPGRAKCFITLSGNVDYPYEIHCRATTGSVATTLSCYQDGQRLDVTGGITDNGLITRGIFWLLDYTNFSCCSHDVTLHVNETMCNDFEWQTIKETTRQTVTTVPTSVTTPTPKVESDTESGACRQFMLPSLLHFTYLFVNLLAFVTMY